MRLPRQERSRESMERTLAATEELLGERRFEEIGVQDIVRRAGTSVGSFYQRFGTKEALLPYLLGRHLERQTAAAATQLAGRDWSSTGLAERVALMVRGALGGLRQGRGLYRALFVRSLLSPAAASRAERAAEERVVQSLVDWLLERRAEIRHPRPVDAARLAVIACYTLLNVLVLFDDAADRLLPDLDDDTLAAELERLALAYLNVSTPNRPRRGRREEEAR
jgi:AcrR family transcriptional regulator